MRSMTIVSTTRNGAVRMTLLYVYPQPGCRVYESVYNRRRTVTADIHVIGSTPDERGTRQAINIPKRAVAPQDGMLP